MQLIAATRWMPVPARYGAVLWLSFLLAAGATGFFFSIVDPDQLAPCLPFPMVSRLGAYTIGFLAFWLFASLSGVLAVAFTYPPPPAANE